jgi:hypothetical protein
VQNVISFIDNLFDILLFNNLLCQLPKCNITLLPLQNDRRRCLIVLKKKTKREMSYIP